jgi:hypothetical protein
MESSPPLRDREIENDNCVEKVTRTCRNTKDLAMLLPEFLSWRITSTVLFLIRLAFLFYLEIFKAQKTVSRCTMAVMSFPMNWQTHCMIE